ncbi:MAG: SDR family oxidoreductase [Clostridia bacterium]
MGKTAIVTGASKGIGYSVMKMLVEKGVNVVAVSRTKADLETAAAELASCGTGEIMIIPADVAIEADILNIYEEAIQKYGSIDYLINCAGVSQRANYGPEDIVKEEFERIMSTNVNSTLYMSREFIKRFTSGYIIQILSTAAYNTGAGAITYSASKYASRSIVEGLATALKGSDIRISSISPGPVNTNIWSHKIEEVPETRKATMLSPEDIAGIAMFLLSTDKNVHIHDVKVEPWHYKK